MEGRGACSLQEGVLPCAPFYPVPEKPNNLETRVRILPFVVFLSAVPAVAATALFPQPLHLVKRIDDPFAKKAITVDEYCYGNRIVTVSGDRVKIVDYDEQQVTEIDHGDGTYSVTRFDDIARARPQAMAAKAAGNPGESSKVTPLGMKGS